MKSLQAERTSDPAGVAPPRRVLLVDDDVEFCELLTEYLSATGFEVTAVHQAEAAVQQAVDGAYAVVVLDVMLPQVDGFEVLRRIRAQSDVPVLMLTARGDDVDRIVGLEIGADDYLPKPFNTRELVARINAVLRRAGAPRARGPAGHEHQALGDLDMDIGARTVRCAGRLVELTGAEFTLLGVLLRAAGRVVERGELSKAVLGRRLMPFDRSIDVHVSNLRKKLGPAPGGSERIKTVRSVGYICVLPGGSSDESARSSDPSG